MEGPVRGDVLHRMGRDRRDSSAFPRGAVPPVDRDHLGNGRKLGAPFCVESSPHVRVRG